MPNEGTRVKCPYCQSGCKRCKDGFINSAFPSGPAFTRYSKVCNDCGTNAGGCIGGPGLPEPKISAQAICPQCRGKNLRLVADED